MFFLRYLLVIFVFFAFCATTAFAAQLAPVTAAEWSEAVQQRYAQIGNMHVFFDQKITHGESGIVEERQGEIYFRKPLQVRWLTKPPAEEILMVTDKFIWQYLPDEELIYKYPLEAVDEQNAFLRILFGLADLRDSFEVTVLEMPTVQAAPDASGKQAGTAEPHAGQAGQAGHSGQDDLPEHDNGGLVKLQLDPYEPSTSLLQSIMWLEADSATLKRLQIRDFYGNLSEMNINSLEANIEIPDAIFEFTPPPGVEIEDHTQVEQIN